MTTAAKGQKDKPFATTPRLLPRATAASTARAVRNATNRNLSMTTSNRQSPPRTPLPSPKLQGKGSSIQRTQKPDSRSDVKISCHSEIDQLDNKSPPIESETFVIEDTSTVILEEGTEDQTAFDADTFLGHESNQIEDRSRPQTPAFGSRPQTPRSVQSSRPQTPCVSSRPTTPAHPAPRHSTPTSHHSTPASCPTTPQRLSTPSRPKTPSNMHTNSRVLSPLTMSSPARSLRQEDDIRSAFHTKQRQFTSMKKELDLKQQAALEAFDNLRNLREQMSRDGLTGGGEEFQLQKFVVFNVADWTSEEITQLCRDAVASSASEGAIELINNTLPIDECAFADLDENVLHVPAHFADLCLQAFTARQEIIDWVKELIEKNENGSGECLERIARYNAQGLELCESLRELKSRADIAVDTISQVSKRAFQERNALVTVGESLVREVARLRQDVETASNAIKELQETQNNMDRHAPYEELRRELEEERSNRVTAKDKLATTESQLRQARMRITKMDRQLREAEASIFSLTGTVKTLEDQSRQREVHLEARARKLKESLKTGEVASSQLVQQRDVLQAEIQDLKQQIETLTAQHKATIHEMTNQLKESNKMLEEQRKITQMEIDQKKSVEAALAQTQSDIDELQAKITEFETNRPNPDLPTEREMDLWAELQSTKETLRMTEDEVTACKREKVRFLETLTKITESENKVGMQQKLAAELLSKEEILGKMQIQIRELTKNIKLNEQKVIQYEQYVRDLQTHHRAVANCQEAPNGVTYEDLQQEIMNLRMGLLESVHRNEELGEQLLQKEQQLDQQDKTSRAQVREELINMLKNKETEQSRELATLQQDLEHRMKIVDEVNKQIAAKADEIQELFATLENKQQQIHRLEKIVVALEEQQRRAQAQRTRHEEKIAALEHELAASGNRKERKFWFL
ncbi:uncharacterized protein LOC142974369 isoform X2 [Anticarsia gemmatalis]|uniref:uncharacterized protein LOC142974369 isoform X2 n=1 Tax=Anticarsia gemmatalis TaxID=129554 RepID=UPI003F77322F